MIEIMPHHFPPYTSREDYRKAKQQTREKGARRTIKVAGISFDHARTGNYKEENFARAEALIRRAAAAGAELVCTCEQFLDGYGFDANKMTGASDEKADRCEEIATSLYVKRLGELARELRVAIVAGVAIREDSKTYNSALIFDSGGRLLGTYRKTHNANKPARWFAPLTDEQKRAACRSFAIGPGRLSVKICNDRHFSETTGYMAANGCELLLCPAFGNYSPSRLRDDSEAFGICAVFVHPQGCQFIDDGKVVLEKERSKGESCFVLHEVEFREPQAPNAFRRPPQTPVRDPYATAVRISKDGVEILYLRKDEIVKDGSVVGRFDGNRVRKDGRIVGEIRDGVFRHEGAQVWKLDKGNLYQGTEVRWDGSIVGDIRADGTIWWQGSRWGTLEPYGGTPRETMRVLAALYYFSDYFRQE